jgi:peroxiredoxin
MNVDTLITSRKGTWPLQTPASSPWTSALIGLALTAFGCSQGSPPDATPARQADTSLPRTVTGDVQVARAEIKISRPEPADDAPAGAGDTGPSEPAQLPQAKAPLPLDDAQAADLTMPRVSLSDAHAETCRVRVGDALPRFQLVDLEGRKQSWESLLGAKLTVVVFWNSGQPVALEELTDLSPNTLDRFSDNGLAVVGINTGDDPQWARELVKRAGARFVNLSDRDGNALQQVASGRIPRTYLIDASGTILWLDLEYSRTTRRDLAQAIRYVLTRP